LISYWSWKLIQTHIYFLQSDLKIGFGGFNMQDSKCMMKVSTSSHVWIYLANVHYRERVQSHVKMEVVRVITNYDMESAKSIWPSCARCDRFNRLNQPSNVQRAVRLAYQPPASSTFLSKLTSHQQPASSIFLSEQTSTSHQPPAKRTGHNSGHTRCASPTWIGPTNNCHLYSLCVHAV
jgi:hypothetical protein